MAFPHAQNPTLVNCSFSEDNRHINTYQNSTTGPPSGALQFLWNAISPGAAYDSEERYPPARCMPDTRVETIKNIEEWAHEGTPVLWLHGPAGAGKSAVAQTMCEKWAEAGLLLASFFISRTAPTRNTIDRFVITIAYQAMLALTGCLDPILSIIESNPHILRQDLNVQLETLLISPLKEFLRNSPKSPDQKPPFIIVIDAIDECSGNENQLRLLSLVHSLLDPKHTLPICFLVVSRPESHITHAVNNLLKSVSTVESLYGDMKDVYKYLEVEFARIHDSERHSEMMMHVSKPWPGHKILGQLTNQSGGYFIYAATVVRHVDEEGYFCVDRLKEILDGDSRALGSYPYRELDKVYSQVLSRARNMHTVKRILGCVIMIDALKYPSPNFSLVPTPSLISAIFSLCTGELKMALRGLHSIVSYVPGGYRANENVSFYHASFSDYLLNQERSGEYYINHEAVIQDICLSSLHLLWNPTGFEQSTPSPNWLAGIMCWSHIGCPGEILAGHLRENVSFLPSIIETSKYWDRGAQSRLLCQFCNMIIILKDSESAKDLVKTLLEICQSALAVYLLHGNESNACTNIQNARTLKEMNKVDLFGSRDESIIFSDALQLSPAEQSCVDRFLYWNGLVRGHWITSIQAALFCVRTAAGFWQNSQEIFGEIFHNFLDNEKYWGDTCRREFRESRVRMHLTASAVGRELLDVIDDPLAYARWCAHRYSFTSDDSSSEDTDSEDSEDPER